MKEQATVLSLGARGKWRGAAFTLAGRTYVKSDAGGHWNEWTLTFDDERVMSLAETAAGFALFAEGSLAPPLAALGIGEPLATGFVVNERGRAKRLARWGETDDAPATYRYADLSSVTGAIATIDYGASEKDAPTVFVGQRVRLKDLGLSPRREPRRFLPAPKSNTPRGLEVWLAVGDEAELEGARYRVIGIMQRSTKSDGETFTWEEYVLFAPAEGVRYLVVSDGHWNFVAPVDAGLVTVEPGRARFDGATYEEYGAGTSRLEWATGELPWEATLGDAVSATDFVHAPYMLSCERSPDEVVWSRGTYLPPDTVAKAFGRRALPKPSGRAPNQPRRK